MSTTTTKSEEKRWELYFAKALMLAIYAPNDESNQRCVAMAEEFGRDLTLREKELITMGIEVALEYLKERDKSRKEALAAAGL